MNSSTIFLCFHLKSSNLLFSWHLKVVGLKTKEKRFLTNLFLFFYFYLIVYRDGNANKAWNEWSNVDLFYVFSYGIDIKPCTPSHKGSFCLVCGTTSVWTPIGHPMIWSEQVWSGPWLKKSLSTLHHFLYHSINVSYVLKILSAIR